MKNINRKNNTQKPEIPGKVKKGFPPVNTPTPMGASW